MNSVPILNPVKLIVTLLICNHRLKYPSSYTHVDIACIICVNISICLLKLTQNLFCKLLLYCTFESKFRFLKNTRDAVFELYSAETNNLNVNTKPCCNINYSIKHTNPWLVHVFALMHSRFKILNGYNYSGGLILIPNL